ncbi:hypothetical protein SNS2_0389 [Streptomyces netropsis]|nr:hypothetical protein SNS2_0389 [Streptomyces netropsis]
MMDPADPVLLFDEDGHMFILHDPAVANELIESPDEFLMGYDGQARPVLAYGEPGQVQLALASAEAQEEKLRTSVAYYDSAFTARHPTRTPPEETNLVSFIRAVAKDWVEE